MTKAHDMLDGAKTGDMGVCALQSMMARLTGTKLGIHTGSKLKAVCDDGGVVEKDGQEEN